MIFFHLSNCVRVNIIYLTYRLRFFFKEATLSEFLNVLKASYASPFMGSGSSGRNLVNIDLNLVDDLWSVIATRAACSHCNIATSELLIWTDGWGSSIVVAGIPNFITSFSKFTF